MLIVKRDTLFDIADAYGLGFEALRGRKLKDPFGPPIFCEDIPQGYITKRMSDDNLRCMPSDVVISDGYPTHLPFPWLRRFHSKRPAKTLGYVQVFQLYCATFAATGIRTKYGVIPERVFLFTGAPGFNLSKIISQLRQHQIKNAMPLFPDVWQHIDFDPLL